MLSGTLQSKGPLKMEAEIRLSRTRSIGIILSSFHSGSMQNNQNFIYNYCVLKTKIKYFTSIINVALLINFQTPHTTYGASLYIKMCVCLFVCVSGHLNRFFGSMNFFSNPSLLCLLVSHSKVIASSKLI